MKINTENNQPLHRKKVAKLLISLGVLAILGISVYIFGNIFSWWNPSSTTQDTSIHSPNLNSGNDTPTDKNSAELPTKTTDEIPVGNNLSATIEQLSQSNGYIYFNGIVNGDDSNGECSLVFANENAKPVSRTIQSTRSGNTSDCGPVQIPEEEFTYFGKWHLTFRYYTHDTQTVAEQDIEVK